MNPHALVTVIAPLPLDRLHEAEQRIGALGNPASPAVAAALDPPDAAGAGTHFMSVNAIPSYSAGRAYLALELSADGTEDAALARIAAAIGPALRPIFALSSAWRHDSDLLAFLRAHRAAIGNGWLGNPGLAFAGTPGMSVGRVRGEGRLATRIGALLGDQPGEQSAMARLDAVRAALGAEPEFAPSLAPGTSETPFTPSSTPLLIAQAAALFARRYLWPIGLLLLAWGIYGGIARARGARGGWSAADFLGGAVAALWGGFWVAVLILLIIAALLIAALRTAEARDSVDARAPDRAVLVAMFERENRLAQNHMLSVTQRKPGALRWFTARLVFWLIGVLVGRLYPPGFLGQIGTIHFARWVTAPGTRDLLFFSNYRGSWESYLEDFIKLAHAGLTAVWSNSAGFPRTENLFQKGATDGERFKRYARRSMIPTRFWYSAYPGLTTSAIRTNAEIRRGLSGAMTEDEAVRWLALFGSAQKPSATLVSTEIQSLVFGGLRFMPFGTCVLIDLPEGQAAARRWLAAILPLIAFNDGRRLKEPAVVTLALAPRGLARLGLAPDALASFPFAFLDGMTAPSRARILGDAGANAAQSWRWGRTQPDSALLVYGKTAAAVAALEATLGDLGRAHGATRPWRVPLQEVKDIDKTEPFGFTDGVSQPVIRGTYKGRRNADPIHLVEPGEFILGYPDNSGNLPPGPTLAATADPQNHLPLVGHGDCGFARTVVDHPRDVGRNGTFLVIREIEQDTAGFSAYCDAEAARLAGRLPEPYEVTPAFIAAKLVGRWQDGSSLTRHPYIPEHAEHERKGTARPTTAPHGATPIERPAKSSHAADNDFLFGAEDPEALRCPFGAHIRRANPRDSLTPGSAEQVAISNRHRIIRVGRRYAPQDGQNPGLFFMCLNGDIERQFEFVQQTWLRSPSFHGLSCEKDPLLGDGETGACGFTVPSREGPVRLAPMPQFATMRGGGYFFMPGKRLLEYLGAAPPQLDAGHPRP